MKEITKDNLIALFKACIEDPNFYFTEKCPKTGEINKQRIRYESDYYYRPYVKYYTLNKRENYVRITPENNEYKLPETPRELMVTYYHLSVIFANEPPIKVSFTSRGITNVEDIEVLKKTLFGWKKVKIQKELEDRSFGHFITCGSFKFDINQTEYAELVDITLQAAKKENTKREENQKALESGEILDRLRKFNIIQ